jgi:hypothetical protein
MVMLRSTICDELAKWVKAREKARKQMPPMPESIRPYHVEVTDLAAFTKWRRAGDVTRPTIYRIILSRDDALGLRIAGDLNSRCEPMNATLEWQTEVGSADWCVHPCDQATLLEYAGCFAYGGDMSKVAGFMEMK